jgi:flagellar protein FliS
MSTPATYSRTLRENAILSASPAQLIVELYDAAQRYLRQGAEAMAAKEVESAHNALVRAELIIRYLDSVLDDEQGELPGTLHSLYGFSLRHINEARMGQEPAKVRAVIRVLARLRSAWQRVAAE